MQNPNEQPEEESKLPYWQQNNKYFWKATFEDGSTKYFGSQLNKFPGAAATRYSNEHKCGRVQRTVLVPKEALKFMPPPFMKEFPRPVDEIPAKLDEGTIKVTDPIGFWNIHDREKYDYLQKEEQKKTPSPDEVADEELLGHIIACQSAFAEARNVLDKVERSFQRFFDFMAESDVKDEDQAELLANMARVYQKQYTLFNDSINKSEVAFEAIIENLEGA